VKRPARRQVKWLDEKARREAELDGLLATCMQHEIDHLNGAVH
jgi:peptide deformylase